MVCCQITKQIEKIASVGLIDYGRGNLRSVEKALERVGLRVQRVLEGGAFESFDALILPGVGAFGDAMQHLHAKNFALPIRNWLEQGRPFLGICLGYQLLFQRSEESPDVPGIGFLKGAVVRFPESVHKIPHIGWNEVIPQNNALFKNMADRPFFYHVHSYYPEAVENKYNACETEYNGVRFTSGISHGAIHAFQFHPEKSQENGRLLLEAFARQLIKDVKHSDSVHCK